MKIASHDITFNTRHEKSEIQQQHELLRYRDGEKSIEIERSGVSLSLSKMASQLSTGERPANLGEMMRDAARGLNPGDRIKLDGPPRGMPSMPEPKGVMTEEDADAFMKSLEDLQLRILEKMLEKFFGAKVNLMRFDPGEAEAPPEVADPNAAQAPAEGQSGQADFSLEYRYDSHYEEHEKMAFSAQAHVTTASGETVNIDVNMLLSRSFVRDESVEIRAGAALKDPLVVNFAGSAAELGERDFTFDIDADGTEDTIAFVRPGSGFLALDKNSNGTIDDGSELFGAMTGDGFAELARYDEDGNGAIDEGDSIFAKLKIMTRDASGAVKLMALAQVDIGAILLEHSDAPFEYKNADGETLGVSRQAGIALKEDFSAVTLQQIDLAV